MNVPEAPFERTPGLVLSELLEPHNHTKPELKTSQVNILRICRPV